MTERKQEQQPLPPAGSDSVQAGQARDQEQELLDQGFEPVYPRRYRYDYGRITSFEAVQEFVKEMNVVFECPPEMFEVIGKNIDLWVEVEEETEDDTTSDI